MEEPLVAPPPRPPAPGLKDFVGKADQQRDADGRYRFESSWYAITTDVDKEVANEIADHMDRVHVEYAHRFAGFRPNPFGPVHPNEKFPLYVLRRYRDYLTLMKGFGFDVAKSGGVYFRGAKASGLATWVEGQTRFKMYSVLQHEGFHQFADARILGGIQLLNGAVIELPPWVNEGLAEYFADGIMVDGNLVLGRVDADRLRRVRSGIRENAMLPLGELMAIDNEAWVDRVMRGDKTSSLIYDQCWSLCHFLIHGSKKRRAAFEQFLLKMNQEFVKEPARDARADVFREVFGNNLDAFDKAWKADVEKLQPDPWVTSVRQLQWVAYGLEVAHRNGIPVRSLPQLNEAMARLRDAEGRDAEGRGEGDARPAAAAREVEFREPARVHFVRRSDPTLPRGVLVTHIVPNLLLIWGIGDGGRLEQEISFLDPPANQLAEIKREARIRAAAPAGLIPVEELKDLPADPSPSGEPAGREQPRVDEPEPPAERHE